jgi:hypothetical protein
VENHIQADRAALKFRCRDNIGSTEDEKNDSKLASHVLTNTHAYGTTERITKTGQAKSLKYECKIKLPLVSTYVFRKINR